MAENQTTAMKILYNLGIMVFLCLNVMAQSASRPISGKVIDINGNALENANVRIKNGRGTVTNVRGEFTLSSVKNTDLIEFSYVGYKTITVQVKDQTSLIISLHPADNELDQVVVQGYGVTSKRLATGNIVTVSSEEIEKHNVMNPLQVLQGNVPGLLMTNISGASSAPAQIEIRGRNTINPNVIAEPLYIIDGVPVTVQNLSNMRNPNETGQVSKGSVQTDIPNEAGGAGGQSIFFGLNPNDIESIEVLKDGDATAIYGSRAANGVILITTKKGIPGKTKAEIKAFTGYSMVMRYHKLLNTQQYVEMRKEALKNDNLLLNTQSAPDLVIWDTTRYTDWQKYLWGSMAKRSSVQAGISGGDNKSSFRFSAGYDYNKDFTTLKGGNYRGTLSVNLSHKSLNNKFQFKASATFNSIKIDVTNRGGSALLPPNAPNIFNENGELNYLGWDPLSSLFSFSALKNNYESKSSFLNTSVSFGYEIINGLKFTTSIGANKSDNYQIRKNTIAGKNPAFDRKAQLDKGHSQFNNLIIEPQIEYSKFIGKGKLALLTGGTHQINRTEVTELSGVNYTNDLFLRTLNAAPTKYTSERFVDYKYAGIYSRVNYNYLNKFIFNINIRRDGSSRFGPGKRYGNFGSLGGSWIVSEEKWMEKISFISFAKIRGSYGVTGSDNIGDYSYLGLWNFGINNAIYNNNLVLHPSKLYDSLLHWEENRKIEFAISMGVLNDRLSFDISFYRNRSDNQLVSFPLSNITGFNSVVSNSPANVENKGFEFLLSGNVIEKKDLKLQLKFSLSVNRNRLIGYPHFDQSPYRNLFEIGKSIRSVKKLKFLNIDPQTGEYVFEDINHDGNITVNFSDPMDDRYLIDLTPKYFGSFHLNFTYKRFNLSSYLYFIKKLAPNILVSYGTAPGNIKNHSAEVMRRWQKTGDISDIGKFTTIRNSNNSNYFNNSDAVISNASFLRLQNLNLSYDFKIKKSDQGGMIGRIYIVVENLFLITKYNGVDPEVNYLEAMPRPRTLTAGFSIQL